MKAILIGSVHGTGPTRQLIPTLLAVYHLEMKRHSPPPGVLSQGETSRTTSQTNPLPSQLQVRHPRVPLERETPQENATPRSENCDHQMSRLSS